MTEIKTICLSEEEVKRIIANHYSVDESKVTIELSEGDPQWPKLSMHTYIEVKACQTGKQ